MRKRARDEILQSLGEAPEQADLDAADEILGRASIMPSLDAMEGARLAVAYGISTLRQRVEEIERKNAALHEEGQALLAGREKQRMRAEQAERQRDEADVLYAKWKVCLDSITGALVDTGNVVPGDAKDYADAIRAVTEQRDRLAEALVKMSEWTVDADVCKEIARLLAEIAR